MGFHVVIVEWLWGSARPCGVTVVLKRNHSPGQVAQLFRALSGNAQIAGLIPGQGTYGNQLMDV